MGTIINLLELIIANLIRSDAASPTEILTAFYNACDDGELFYEGNGSVTDKKLDNFFKGLDISLKALRKMEM